MRKERGRTRSQAKAPCATRSRHFGPVSLRGGGAAWFKLRVLVALHGECVRVVMRESHTAHWLAGWAVAPSIQAKVGIDRIDAFLRLPEVSGRNDGHQWGLACGALHRHSPHLRSAPPLGQQPRCTRPTALGSAAEASAGVESDKPGLPALFKFLRPHTVRGTILASVTGVARAITEQPEGLSAVRTQ